MSDKELAKKQSQIITAIVLLVALLFLINFFTFFNSTSSKSATYSAGVAYIEKEGEDVVAIRGVRFDDTTTNTKITDVTNVQTTQQLRNVAESVQEINVAQEDLRERLIQEVESGAKTTLSTIDSSFDDVAKKEEISSRVNERLNEAMVRIDTAFDGSIPNTESVTGVRDVVIDTLTDFEVIVSEETGRSVSFQEERDLLRDTVIKKTSQLDEQRMRFIERGGLSLYLDSDNDSVSDYDEHYIYGTDPFNAYSAGREETDGAYILSGRDPIKGDVITYEDVRVADSGVLIEYAFSLSSVSVGAKRVDSGGSESVAAITFSGRALPNSFVTIYIYSTPVVVTVKSDQSGKWIFTLTEELVDGDHELYVATVNNSGKVIAKSTSIPFVKEAGAVSLKEDLSTFSYNASGEYTIFSRESIILLSLALIAIFIIAIIIIGYYKEHGHTKEPRSPFEDEWHA